VLSLFVVVCRVSMAFFLKARCFKRVIQREDEEEGTKGVSLVSIKVLLSHQRPLDFTSISILDNTIIILRERNNRQPFEHNREIL
jgi:hypothetical protein